MCYWAHVGTCFSCGLIQRTMPSLGILVGIWQKLIGGYWLSPPDSMLRLPRSVTCRKYWKASEFRNFLLYYSVPCLRGILPTEYYNHLLFLVHGIYTLLKGSISIEELTTAHISVSTFHKQFQDLYGLRNMRYNLHLLNHIAQCVLDWGPLWANSAFG